MSSIQNKYKFLFAGGGTGGHLFPAVAVAEQIKEMRPDADILFIGTRDKIEGKVVPKLGFKFKSIWIRGFSRKINIENLLFPLRLIVSIIQSLIVNMSFKPSVAIGSGGYVAGPGIWAASVMGAKIILLEQNTYPGVTTRLLEKYADESLVLVKLDFPRNIEQSAETQNYNRNLAQKYGIQGFPTILIFNSQGKLVAQTGYQPGGPEKYIEHIKSYL